MQTFYYVNRQVSLNRKQTHLEEDGSFRIVIAHEDPGVPNWIDTEGRGFSMVFWRFMLPEGEIETPKAQVVKVADLGVHIMGAAGYVQGDMQRMFRDARLGTIGGGTSDILRNVIAQRMDL